MLAAVRRREHDVRGLHVTVDEPAAVGGVESRRDLLHDRHDPVGVEPSLAHDHRAQIGPLDPAHGDEQAAVGLARLVHGDHVRVVDRRGQLGLALEAAPEVRVVGELGDDHLHGDLAIQGELGGAVDATHAALSGQALDSVAGQDRANRHLGHRREYRAGPP